MKPVIRIRNWKIREIGGRLRLEGDAERHPTHGSEYVRTSHVLALRKDIGKVETRNSFYQLIGRGECLVERQAPRLTLVS